MSAPRIVHIRNRDAEGRALQKGGITLAISEDGTKVGIAVCSERDDYVRSVLGDGVRWTVARLWYIEGCVLGCGVLLPSRVIVSAKIGEAHGQDYTEAARRCVARHSGQADTNDGVMICYPRSMNGARWAAVFTALDRLAAQRTVAS